MKLSPQGLWLAAVRSKEVVLFFVDLLLIVTSIASFCNCYMFCCAFLCVLSSFVIILIGKGESVALLCLSSLCLMIAVWLFLTMPWVCLQFMIVVFLDHTYLLFLTSMSQFNGI